MKTCGLDMHKDSIFCAIFDEKESSVEKFGTFTPELRRICQYIKGFNITTAAMESKGIYIDAVRTVSEGETSPSAPLILLYGRIRSKKGVSDALAGCIEQRHVWQLRQAFSEFDLWEKMTAETVEKMECLSMEHYHEDLRLIQTIPGIDLTAVRKRRLPEPVTMRWQPPTSGNKNMQDNV